MSAEVDDDYSRQVSALGEPVDLSGFPQIVFDSSKLLYRAVTYERPKPRGAWWFNHVTPGKRAKGRFDLPANDGTCYLSTDIQTAIREKVGRRICYADLVPISLVEAMELVELRLPEARILANTSDMEAANWGVIREIGASSENYDLTSRWAKMFQLHGFCGILYGSRFTSCSDATAIALFGEYKLQPWPEGRRISGLDAFRSSGIDKFISPIPSSKSVSVVILIPPEEF